MMKVSQLFYKPQKSKPIHPTPSLILMKGYGIKNDIHAQWGSPRQILIVSQSTLQQFHLQPGDLGENILVDGQIESFQSGQVLKIGHNVLIRLMFHCEPCKTLEKVQPGLMKKIKNRRGFLGMVIQGGIIQPEDEISLTFYQFPSLSEQVKHRFDEFISRIPKRKVVNTGDLLLALGVSQGYYRAIPTFIKKADDSLPIHRILKKDGSLLTQYRPNQKELLQNEGVIVRDDKVIYSDYAWNKTEFHQTEFLN